MNPPTHVLYTLNNSVWVSILYVKELMKNCTCDIISQGMYDVIMCSSLLNCPWGQVHVIQVFPLLSYLNSTRRRWTEAEPTSLSLSLTTSVLYSVVMTAGYQSGIDQAIDSA